MRLDRPKGWLQARRVTLLYKGVVASEVFWSEYVVDEPIPDALFAPPVQAKASASS